MVDKQTQQSADALAGLLAPLERRIKQLEKAQRQTQLPYSTIDNGSILVRDANGTLRQTIGIQADGSVTTADHNSPPPPAPTAPTLTAAQLGLTVTWDGGFADGSVQAADFDHVEIHVSLTDGFTPDATTLRASIKKAGDFPLTPLEVVEQFIVLVSVNTSGTKSDPSAQASGTPLEVVASDIADGIVTTVKLADDAVTNAKIADIAVDATKLADGSVDASKILTGTITTAQISPTAGITAGQVSFPVGDGKHVTISSTAPSSPVNGDLWFDGGNGYALKQWNGSAWVAFQYGTNAIAAGSVTAALIAANTITAAQIAGGTITAAQIAAGTITASLIAAGTITASQIATDTITAGQIAAGAIGASELAANSVIAGKIAAGTVDTTALAANSVTATNIAAGAVTTSSLAANAVTSSKISAGAIVSGSIAAGAIDGMTINGNVINGALINAGTATFSDSAGGGLFGYNAGVLTVSLAGSPGVDTSGYSFPAGFAMGEPGLPQVLLSQDVAGAYLALPTNDASEVSASQVNAEIVSGGTASQQLGLFVGGPANGSSTDKNLFEVAFTSDSSDNTVPAQLLISDAFNVPYLSASNKGGSAPVLSIGSAFGAQFPVTAVLNGALLTYGGSAGQQVTQTFSTAGTHNWVCPAGVTTLSKVEVWGGGGGGGGGSAPTTVGNGGCGGGGAGYTVATGVAATSGHTYAVVVGDGGAGGAAGTPTGLPGGNGAAGSNSVFPANSGNLTGGGGGGGTGGHNGHTGGAGGSGTAAGGTGGNAPFDGTSTGGAGGGGSGGPSGGGVGGGGVSGRNPGAGGTGNRGGLSGGDGAGGGWGSNSNNGSKGGNGVAPGGGGGGGGGGTDAHTYGGGAGAAGTVRITYTQPGTTQILASMANAATTDASGNAAPAGFMGQIVAVKPSSSPSVAETWHLVSYQNSWAAFSAGLDLMYELKADGFVHLSGRLSKTAAVSGSSVICTLPAGYRPVRTEMVHVGSNASATPFATTPAVLQIDTGGGVTFFGSYTANTALNIQGSFPLNA